MENKLSTIQSIFKPFLSLKKVYKGGKSIKASSQTPKVYKLSSNENPIGPSPLAMEAVRRYSENLHIYPDRTDERLREALVKDFSGALTTEQFLAAPSGSEVIDLMLRAFVREEDEVIVCNPCFLPYEMFAKWLGARVIDVPLQGNSYALDVPAILAAISPRTKVIFLASPNNPTGTYIPKSVLANLLDQLPSNIVVILDEVYRHFADATDYTSALPFVQAGKNVLAVNSFSKTYGLAGMRVGYCYSTPAIANYIRQICKPFFIPTLSLAGAIAALEDKDFIKETVSLVHKERIFLADAFTQLGISFTPTQANFYLIDPPGTDRELVDHLFAKGIMVRPVTSFGAPGKVRITIGTREANEALVKALESLVLRAES